MSLPGWPLPSSKQELQDIENGKFDPSGKKYVVSPVVMANFSPRGGRGHAWPSHTASQGDLSCHLPRCVASSPPPCSPHLSPCCRRPSRPAPSRSGEATPPSPPGSMAWSSWGDF